jgi:hypothetical protein
MTETEIPREMLMRIAAIIGPESAASKALAEIDRRRQVGEDARCYMNGSMYLVGPALSPPSKD